MRLRQLHHRARRPPSNLITLGQPPDSPLRPKLPGKYSTDIDELLTLLNEERVAPKAASKDKPATLRSLSLPKANSASLHLEAAEDYRRQILLLQKQLQTSSKTSRVIKQKNEEMELELKEYRRLLVSSDTTIVEIRGETIQSLVAKNCLLQDRLDDLRNSKEKEIEGLKAELTLAHKQLEIYRALGSEGQSGPTQSEVIRKSLEGLQSYRKELRVRLLEIDRLNERYNQQSNKQSIPSIIVANSESLATIDNPTLDEPKREKQIKMYEKLTLKKNDELLALRKEKEELRLALDTGIRALDRELKSDRPTRPNEVGFMIEKLVGLRNENERKLKLRLDELAQKVKELGLQHSKRESELNESLLAARRQSEAARKRVAQLEKQTEVSGQKIKQLEKAFQTARKGHKGEKEQFVSSMKEMSLRMSDLIRRTENEDNRHKLQQLKLIEQNRSLMMTLNERERDLAEKTKTLELFEQYKKKLSTLELGTVEREGLPSVQKSELKPTAKAGSVNNFPQWLHEWNRIKNWVNRKALLFRLAQSQELRNSALKERTRLCSVLNQAFLENYNREMQEAAVLALRSFGPEAHKLQMDGDRVWPLVIRSLRDKFQNQSAEQHKCLNEAALWLLAELEEHDHTWTLSMSNEMVSVNGLKYLISNLSERSGQQCAEFSLTVLILIARSRQLIPFMGSYGLYPLLAREVAQRSDLTELSLQLLLILLKYEEFVRTVPDFSELKNMDELLQQPHHSLLLLVLSCLLQLVHLAPFSKHLDNRVAASRALTFLLAQENGQLSSLGLEHYKNVIENSSSKERLLIGEEGVELLAAKLSSKSSEVQLRALKVAKLLVQLIPERGLRSKVVQAMKVLLVPEQFALMDIKVREKIVQLYKAVQEKEPELMANQFTPDFRAAVIRNYILCKESFEGYVFLGIIQQFCFERESVSVLREGRADLLAKLVLDLGFVDLKVALRAAQVTLLLAREVEVQRQITADCVDKLVKALKKEAFSEEYRQMLMDVVFNLSKRLSICVLLEENGLLPYLFGLFARKLPKTYLFSAFLALQQMSCNLPQSRVLQPVLKPDLVLLSDLCEFMIAQGSNPELGPHTLFVWDFLKEAGRRRELAKFLRASKRGDQPIAMVQTLIEVRNQFSSESAVFKVQALLHEMAREDEVIRKEYQQFQEEG